jgi:hypothetical protein
MVIQFHPGSNSSLAGPAPSLYPEPIASSTILADTTAATNKVMTTTTQTTHFFSLPLWRKRGSPVSTSLPDSMSGLDADENGMVRPPPRSSMFMVEKDLPPTPPPEPFLTPCDVTPEKAVIPPIQVTLPTPEVITHPEQMSNTRQPVRSGTALSQPAVALAHAALRLGLPYVMPHASSSSEVNSVAFVPSIPQPQDLCLPISHARRAGGSRVLGPASSGETPGINGQASYSRERRRARGISLGGAGLFQFATEGKEKTKALDTSNPVPKVLSRRPSFWSRRRTAHSTEVSLVLPSLAVSDVPQTSLSLPPISPLNIEQTSHASSQPSPSNENHSPLCRGLSRSHSERTSLRRPSGGSKDEIPPVPSVKPRRPSTADSFGMSRARSFLLDGSHSETLPLRPPLRYQETFQPPLSNIPSQCRPRAHTNPPLLHRLSASIFSSSPYSSTSNINNNYVSSPTASIDSPRTSLHNLPAKLLKPQSDEESPEVYLNRLSAAVSKADVAAVLASR